MSNYYYTNISKLEIDDMDMTTQAAIVEKRGEFDLAAYLRQIIVEDKNEHDIIVARKVAAENAVFLDEDF